MAGKLPFFTPKDLDFFRGITLETSDLFFREIEVKLLKRSGLTVDDLYGETKNLSYDTYHVRAQVELTPKKATLKKFGLNEERDLMVTVDVGVLDREELPVPDVGDLVIVQGENYKILDFFKADYFWHQEDNLTVVLMCERFHPRSVDDTELTDPYNPAGPSEVENYYDEDFPGEGA